MNATNSPSATLPHSVTKKQLFSMYLSQMTERQIRDGINSIIRDNRKLPPNDPVYDQLVWNVEFMEFVDTYGLPKGYKR